MGQLLKGIVKWWVGRGLVELSGTRAVLSNAIDQLWDVGPAFKDMLASRQVFLVSESSKAQLLKELDEAYAAIRSAVDTIRTYDEGPGAV